MSTTLFKKLKLGKLQPSLKKAVTVTGKIVQRIKKSHKGQNGPNLENDQMRGRE